MSRPSDGMTLEDLCEEYDWMYEFQSRMAERISGDPDVHNLVDYVNRLAAENDKLRELVRESVSFELYGCYGCSHEDTCEPQEIYDEECIRRQGIEQSMRELGVEI